VPGPLKPLDVICARRLSNYSLVLPGRDRRFGTRDDRVFRFRAARSQQQTLPDRLGVLSTVTLTPASRVRVNRPVQLHVRGTLPEGLTDRSGRWLDGSHDGHPGGNFPATINGQGVVSFAAASPP
jgi:hypothetical protein